MVYIYSNSILKWLFISYHKFFDSPLTYLQERSDMWGMRNVRILAALQNKADE